MAMVRVAYRGVRYGRVTACGGHGGSGPSTPPTTGGSRQFRAIAGVSMGAYGAMNIGTKHADLFGTIAALGGPVDMRQLLRDMVNDNLEVKSLLSKLRFENG